jgi:enoyl-CoA hydratase
MANTAKELVRYRVEEGVCVLELDDAPANTYSYEMMQQLDAATPQFKGK